jgi:predicted O-methyltransferase YrrM
LPLFRSRFDTFRNESANEVGFSFANDYFPSPDAEVLYAMVRLHQPSRILEIGSGNSTRIIRQAIRDGKMRSALVSVDPQPRRQVLEFADQWIESRVEDCDMGLFDLLSSGDILFIDSSHEVSTGNDGAVLYGAVLPRLARGVLVHIHDVFLPFEYPLEIRSKGASSWNEQYVVQSMLANGAAFEVIWAGYYLHTTNKDISKAFPYSQGRPGQSLWLRKVAESTLAH